MSTTLLERSTRRIGFLDDNPEMRRAVRRFASANLSLTLVDTSQPREAIEWVARGEIDLLIADLHLGLERMNGLDVLEEARQASNEVDLALFTTASATRDLDRRLRNVGGEFYDKIGALEEFLSSSDASTTDIEHVADSSAVDASVLKEEIADSVLDSFVEHLLSDPQSLELELSWGPEVFTVRQLVHDVRSRRPRGMEYALAWFRARLAAPK